MINNETCQGSCRCLHWTCCKTERSSRQKGISFVRGSGLLLMNSLSLFSHPIPCAAVIIEEVNFSLIITKTHLVQSQAFLISRLIAIFAGILIFWSCILYLSFWHVKIFFMILPDKKVLIIKEETKKRSCSVRLSRYLNWGSVSRRGPAWLMFPQLRDPSQNCGEMSA